MSADVEGAPELVDAATVHAARRDVVQAVAALAASPLSERAADRMRAALARATSPTVQRAVDRIASPRRPPAAKRATLVGLPPATEEEPGIAVPVSAPGGAHQLGLADGFGGVG